MRLPFFATTAIAAVFTLTACGGNETTYRTEDGTATVSQNGEDMNIEFRGNDGQTATLTSGQGANVELMAGFTVYPGSSNVQNTTVRQNDGGGSIVTMAANATGEQMIAFYKRQAEAAGIPLQMELTSGTMRMIGGEGEGGLTFSFTATESEDGGETIGQLVVGRGN